MKKAVLLISASAALFTGAMLSAQDTSVNAVDTNAVSAGLAAWEKAFEVFSHPRCANCHVADGVPRWSGPHYGGAFEHPMYVGGDPELLFGQPGMLCNTCHMPENASKLHGPPGAEVWHLPPAEMVWWEKSSAEICAQIKDPERNGGRTLADIEMHIAEDALVAWGWDPGPGRTPAPYSAEETALAIAQWAAAGAPCPAE